MFHIDDNQTIHLTRGDIAVIEVSANTPESTEHIFKSGDIVRLKVFERKRPDAVVLEKNVTVDTDTTVVTVSLGRDDTKFGDLISKPTNYWYEVELNPDTNPQTFIGYDTDGPKIFRLYPEGGESD